VSVALQAPLAPLTTLRLGGPAGRLETVERREQLVELVKAADAAAETVFVLAGGSNVVIADDGVPGLVALVATRGVERVEEADRVALTVEAGEPWDELVAMTVGEGLSGLECLSGIPGSAGATPIQNVGAYGQEVADVVRSVRVLDRRTGEVEDLSPQACGFRYRTSVFKRSERWVVLAVTYVLPRASESRPLRYAELAAALGVEPGATAPLAEVREAVLSLRRAKGMVVDPGDPDSVSAGSFFTNPVLSPEALEEVERRAGEAPPRFPAGEGLVKTSSAWLIERSGFSKGDTRGRVAISSKHALALVNRGGASTAELVALAREIAAGVRERFGVELRPEPVFVGHDW
jgi:UDP-N-acetylmuramate dehydrogenase